MTKLLILLWLAQMNMTHMSPPSLPVPPPQLLPGLDQRATLKLEVFLDSAERNNPTLRQADAMIRRMQAQARQASLYPNPTIGYEGDQIRGGSFGGGEQGGFVQQTIVLGGKLDLRREVYEQQTQADRIAASAQLVRVRNEVTQLYYQAVGAQRMVEVRGRLLALATQAAATAHQLANIGQADVPDVLQSEVEAEQAQIDYTTAQRIFIQKFKSLAAIAGNPSMQLAPLDANLDSLPQIDVGNIVTTLVEQSPAVKQAQQQVAVAEAKLKQARHEVVPDLQLRAGEQNNLEALPEAPGRKTGAQSFASAGVEVPLWNRNQGNVQAAQAELEMARLEVTRVQLGVRQQAEPLLQNYAAARQEVELYENDLLPRARQAYELNLEKYEAMAQAYPQVIVSQRTLFGLEVHLIDALQSAWQNGIALENFTLGSGKE